MSVKNTRFDMCQDIDNVLRIGREFAAKDGYRGAHYDTVKLLCDTIEHLRESVGNAVVMRDALQKLERRFQQNVDAYQDRYFTYSYRNWHKKAVEAEKWRDIFSDLREEVRAALEPKNKEVGRGGLKMDDKKETSTDIIGEMCKGPIPQHDWEVLHRYEYLFKEALKHKSAATAVGNAAKMREALEHVEKLANELAAGNYYVSDFPKMLHDAIQPALSAPPRNCDLVEGRTADDEFEKAMGFPPSKTADERDNLMRENWFLFKAWLFDEAKGEINGSK